MPATLSILMNVFRDPRERARAIAVWAGFSGLGVAIGPITGGLLLEHFSWSSVFWVNIPIGVAALILGAFLVPTSRDPEQGKIDPLGAVLSFVGLAALLFGIIEGPSKGWTEPLVLGAFVLAAASLASFLIWEQRTAHPMLDLSVFKNPRFSAGQRHDHDRLLRTVRLTVPDDPVLAARARLQPARSRHPAAALRCDDDDRRPALGAIRRASRHQARRARRSHVGDDRAAAAVVDRIPVPVPAGHLLLHADGRRHGDDDGAGDGSRHGFAPSGQGRRRLGDQRHDPPGRRCPRRRHHRHDRQQRLRLTDQRCGRDVRPRRRPGGGGRVVARRRPERRRDARPDRPMRS